MSLMRSILLAASQNRWLRDHATRYGFVRRSVSRFMPGETLDDALGAAQSLHAQSIAAVFTHLGENISDAAEAEQVATHYLEVLRRNHAQAIGTEISVKLTQLGLDLSPDLCFEKLQRIISAEDANATVWIDMEASDYVDATLALYRRCLAQFPNVGICLQAYLFRTKADLDALLPLRPSVRLVKGAYKEPPAVAFPQKSDVDANYFSFAQTMLRAKRDGIMPRAAFGTHDGVLIRRITDFAAAENISRESVEVQMLFGIQRAEQLRLAREGYRSGVLVAYGAFWYPWFVRRLAERPANLWFMLRNVFAR